MHVAVAAVTVTCYYYHYSIVDQLPRQSGRGNGGSGCCRRLQFWPLTRRRRLGSTPRTLDHSFHSYGNQASSILACYNHISTGDDDYVPFSMDDSRRADEDDDVLARALNSEKVMGEVQWLLDEMDRVQNQRSQDHFTATTSTDTVSIATTTTEQTSSARHALLPTDRSKEYSRLENQELQRVEASLTPLDPTRARTSEKNMLCPVSTSASSPALVNDARSKLISYIADDPHILNNTALVQVLMKVDSQCRSELLELIVGNNMLPRGNDANQHNGQQALIQPERAFWNGTACPEYPLPNVTLLPNLSSVEHGQWRNDELLDSTLWRVEQPFTFTARHYRHKPPVTTSYTGTPLDTTHWTISSPRFIPTRDFANLFREAFDPFHLNPAFGLPLRPAAFQQQTDLLHTLLYTRLMHHIARHNVYCTTTDPQETCNYIWTFVCGNLGRMAAAMVLMGHVVSTSKLSQALFENPLQAYLLADSTCFLRVLDESPQAHILQGCYLVRFEAYGFIRSGKVANRSIQTRWNEHKRNSMKKPSGPVVGERANDTGRWSTLQRMFPSKNAPPPPLHHPRQNVLQLGHFEDLELYAGMSFPVQAPHPSIIAQTKGIFVWNAAVREEMRRLHEHDLASFVAYLCELCYRLALEPTQNCDAFSSGFERPLSRSMGGHNRARIR